MTVLARVVIPHSQTEDGYHEWVSFGQRIKADKLGRWNSRMHDANWTWWTCNSPDCAGLAYVSDAGSRALIEEAYESQWPRHYERRKHG